MHHLRRHYTLGGIDEHQMLDDPVDQLQLWFDEAIKSCPVDWFEPNAATLATASRDGQVTARIVLLKGLDQHGLFFFTNYDSPKGQQLAENPRAALVIYWPHMERQVRVEGSVERVSREMSATYFQSRPRGSQISAAISPQSVVLPSRAHLDELAAAKEHELQGGPVPLPANWGGYRLQPDMLEFWQGRENRLHDRIRYRRDAAQWIRQRLAP
jgi:pyridoxamine 5'-phosphate oxidase